MENHTIYRWIRDCANSFGSRRVTVFVVATEIACFFLIFFLKVECIVSKLLVYRLFMVTEEVYFIPSLAKTASARLQNERDNSFIVNALKISPRTWNEGYWKLGLPKHCQSVRGYQTKHNKNSN